MIRTVLWALLVQFPGQSRLGVGPMLPDAQTARSVAYVLLARTYGRAVIDRELPLTATLRGNVWSVSGRQKISTRKEDGNHINIALGGFAAIELDRRNCRVVRVTHGK